MFLAGLAPFGRRVIRLSNGIKCFGKKYCYNIEIIYQTQIPELFVPSLYDDTGVYLLTLIVSPFCVSLSLRVIIMVYEDPHSLL